MRICETKFLGIIIEANLERNTYLRFLQDKISKTVGILIEVKNILTTAHLKT
jgi:hypothetical protein